MPDVSCRRDTPAAHAARRGQAVCELLAAFAVVAILAMLLMPSISTPPVVPAAAGRPAERPTFRLHNALMNLQLSLETGMIEAYDGWFHAAGDRPPIIDVFPGIDTAAAEADAEASDLCVDHDAAS